jgi:hypothetical protein
MSDTRPADAPAVDARYATTVFEGGGCLVYDRENRHAWVQAADADSMVPVER